MNFLKLHGTKYFTEGKKNMKSFTKYQADVIKQTQNNTKYPKHTKRLYNVIKASLYK